MSIFEKFEHPGTGEVLLRRKTMTTNNNDRADDKKLMNGISGIISAFGYKDGIINDIGVAPQGLKEIIQLVDQNRRERISPTRDQVVRLLRKLAENGEFRSYKVIAAVEQLFDKREK